MTSRPEKRLMQHAKASGIVRDNVSGSSFIPATQVKTLDFSNIKRPIMITFICVDSSHSKLSNDIIFGFRMCLKNKVN